MQLNFPICLFASFSKPVIKTNVLAKAFQQKSYSPVGQNCVSFLGPAQKDSNIINEILHYHALCEEGVFIPIINAKKIKFIKKMPSVSNQSDVAEAIAEAGIVDLT